MRFLVLSDTHGFSDNLKRLESILDTVDAIIHLGDHAEDIKCITENRSIPVYALIGNCDSSAFGQKEILIKVGSESILMTHGHHYDVKHSLMNLFYKGKEIGASVILFGHTHIPITEFVEGIWLHNPGSLSLPKLNREKTFSLMTIDDEGVRFDERKL